MALAYVCICVAVRGAWGGLCEEEWVCMDGEKGGRGGRVDPWLAHPRGPLPPLNTLCNTPLPPLCPQAAVKARVSPALNRRRCVLVHSLLKVLSLMMEVRTVSRLFRVYLCPLPCAAQECNSFVESLRARGAHRAPAPSTANPVSGARPNGPLCPEGVQACAHLARSPA